MSKFNDLIPENVAPPGTQRIGIYNSKGVRAGQIPLGSLRKKFGKKLYSFGAISDIHIGESTADSDYVTALSWLSENADFICECGDLIHGNSDSTAAQIETYTACRTVASVPVYAISGNHDGAYVENVETVITSYTGQPLYYSFEKGEDAFIMVGIRSNGRTTPLFADGELDWLAEELEKYKDRRVFLFQHVRPDDACGNALGVYKVDIWGDITGYPEQTTFEGLLRAYPNVIFFHGHSHLKFHLQKYEAGANIDRTFGCLSVHIPSLSVPRDTSSAVDPSIVNVYAASEGYLVDVYENGIHLRGRDFVKGEYLPIASYWLDT